MRRAGGDFVLRDGGGRVFGGGRVHVSNGSQTEAGYPNPPS